mmetsp:Transcript_34956/g.49603  ORF Transcript_34956/g.49603 Transcript_34956/m.49603 type:complete len:80 (+) Transcript_34956:60-299(+)
MYCLPMNNLTLHLNKPLQTILYRGADERRLSIIPRSYLVHNLLLEDQLLPPERELQERQILPRCLELLQFLLEMQMPSY